MSLVSATEFCEQRPYAKSRRVQSSVHRTSDYAAFAFMPSLAARIRAPAPSVRIVVRHTSHVRGLAMLDNGETELIVGNLKEGSMCAACRNHPAFAGKLT